MTAQIIRPGLIEAPEPKRQKYGLLDEATVQEGLTWVDPDGMFVSWNCVVGGSLDRCDPGAPDKDFQSPATIDGTEFVVYLGGECNAVGSADMKTALERSFDLQESMLVELRFEEAILSTADDAGTAESATESLAKVRSLIAFTYAGVPTIHVGVETALALWESRALVEVGGHLETPFGSKVVIGVGYAQDTVYATGEVGLLRGPKQVVEVVDTTNNNHRVLVERDYIAYADCVAYKSTYTGG